MSRSATTNIDGKRKAAILLIAMGKKASAAVLKEMGETEVEMVSKEIAHMENVPKDVLNQINDEFREMMVAQECIAVGGIEYTREVLEQALRGPKALDIIKKVQRSKEARGFSALKKLDTEHLVSFIQKEHPQTVALVLTQLDTQQSAAILQSLPDDIRNDVMFRFATMDKVAPEYIKEVERVLESKVDMTESGKLIGGVQMAADVLNFTEQTVEKKILGEIGEKDPELASSIKNLMFVFEDMITPDDKSIQRVLKDVDQKELAVALKAASEKMKEKILSNMSERAATLIREEMEYMGPMKLKDVEKAQKKIVDIVRRLDEEGEILIAGPGSREEIIV